MGFRGLGRFNERGDTADIYPSRWEIIKHVRLVPPPWRVHEEIQASQVEKISRRMERLGVFIAPIIGSSYSDLEYVNEGQTVKGSLNLWTRPPSWSIAIIGGYFLDIYSSYPFGTQILALLLVSFTAGYV